MVLSHNFPGQSIVGTNDPLALPSVRSVNTTVPLLDLTGSFTTRAGKLAWDSMQPGRPLEILVEKLKHEDSTMPTR